MSNMKLYTEIQMLEAIDSAIFSKSNINSFDILEDFTPIELPSDEEIKKQFDIDEFDPYDLAYLGGAIRMRNLILIGNK